MDSKQPVQELDKTKQPEAESMDSIVARAVASALAAQRHQHAPLLLPELTGRTRAEGTLIETKLGETKSYVEVQYNDGTIRRDYK